MTDEEIGFLDLTHKSLTVALATLGSKFPSPGPFLSGYHALKDH
jgi:hypothetical protein